MADGSFLDGLFLEEQLKAARNNQRTQNEFSREAQLQSQAFAREQADLQNTQFLASLGEQRKQREAQEANQQFMRQFQMAGALASDQLRLPNAAGMSQFLDQGMPQVQGEFQPTPNADPVAPPMFTQTPRVDSTYATAPMPAPAGSLFQIGNQQILIPSQGQRLEEKIASQNLESDAASKQKIAAVEKYIALFPDSSPLKKDEMRARMLLGFNTHPESINQGISEANDELFDALRRGDEPARKLAVDKRNALVEIQNGFYKTQAVNRGGADPMRQPMFEATQFLSSIDPQITQVARQLFPSSKVLSDEQKHQAAVYILDNPQVQKQLNIALPAEKLAFLRMALKRITTGYAEDESVGGIPGKIGGPNTGNVTPPVASPTTGNPLDAAKAAINAQRAARGLAPIP